MASPSNKLNVRIIRAEGLQHMNHFTGDHPYVTCAIKRAEGEVVTKADTKPVTEGDTLNPIWDETLEFESWQPGETLEFTVYDKGLLGSKSEGKALLPSEFFYPHGFQGMLAIIGLPDAKLEQPGETLEFTVYDKGLLGSKSEGKALLPSEFFYPHGFQGMLAIIGLPDAKLEVEIKAVGAQDEEPSLGQDPGLATDGAPEVGENVAVPQKLAVSILQAHGLKHMNNFTGDNPYVVCEVKHHDPAAETTRVETKPVAEGDTLNSFWGETHNLEPWFEGESLEFTIYDKGLVASKTEGKVVLPCDIFSPQGFSGMVAISGLPHALLHVIVRPLGPLVSSGETAEDSASSKKKKKKVKVSKKSKQCC
eukprot:CAMPEP_0172940278 /NCGR_PEP_ID=MMETSP1075-20121228/223953_1 /TAXON_ID=2916 /ORGANISM="Ceratium fusus, Strain PA161109" /LENGTH=364 /DNA_ID=CAMNT_0013801673 /DNA_START=45 /DNA_END=1139 /DNA_ORIENTATION=+